jgi:hypothetical protein
MRGIVTYFLLLLSLPHVGAKDARAEDAAATPSIHEAGSSKGDLRVFFVDGNDAYVSSPSGCFQVLSLREGAFRPIVEKCPPGRTRAVIARGSTIVWAQGTDSATSAGIRNRLFGCRSNHCVPRPLGPQAAAADSFVFVKETLYASFSPMATSGRTRGPSVLLQIDPQSGRSETLAKATHPMQSLTTDGVALYYYMADAERAIRRKAPGAKGQPETLVKGADDGQRLVTDDFEASLDLDRAAGLGHPHSSDFHGIVDVDDHFVYWKTRYVHRFRKQDRAVETLRDDSRKPLPLIGYLAVDRGHFYYGSVDGPSLLRVPKAGGRSETMVENQSGLRWPVVNNGRLIWSVFDAAKQETRFRWVTIPTPKR